MQGRGFALGTRVDVRTARKQRTNRFDVTRCGRSMQRRELARRAIRWIGLRRSVRYASGKHEHGQTGRGAETSEFLHAGLPCRGAITTPHDSGCFRRDGYRLSRPIMHPPPLSARANAAPLCARARLQRLLRGGGLRSAPLPSTGGAAMNTPPGVPARRSASLEKKQFFRPRGCAARKRRKSRGRGARAL